MKQTKKPAPGRARLAALGLALALFLTGCAPAADAPAEESAAEETSAAAVETEDVSQASEPEETPSENVTQTSRDADLLECELLTIDEDELQEIDVQVAGMQTQYVAGPGGEDPLVKKRDWSAYTSGLSRQNLSSSEAKFYDRLDKLCMEYLSKSALSGVKVSGKSGVFYATSSVRYSDLSLTDQQAKDVYNWFRYNSPQYYFLNAYVSASNGVFYGYLYDFVSGGEARAKVTNELFDKLDGYIQTVADSAATTWQVELLTNNLLCDNNVYQKEYMGNARIDQSLYSSIVMGSTVCTGYAEAFCAITNALGMNTVLAISDTHAWNVVHFDDGNYYCVDVCWNDTGSERDRYLNVGEADSKARDTGKEHHTYKTNYVNWIPAIAKNSYTPTDYDTSTTKISLGAPANVQVTKNGATTIEFSWDKVEGADQYYAAVFRDPEHKEIWVDWQRTSTSASVSKLRPETTYYYGIRAMKTVNGEEYYSDWTYFSQTTASAP